ncbi:hypothetical protein OPV22_015068 [Ensete ventricosum]|uniref:Uncharacterized protein n=1 Tax=Ensete ventricosum TaxID=4639 RepID=A0AAV8RCT5_ENSVE|nr:hypothetical protein OPV22_015068 [Ensete ventricosum]
MEKPSNSSTGTSEESSWASYFADFVATQQAEDSMRASKKLSPKRRKTVVEDDDPLEDTATSPVKPRGVGVSDQSHMKPGKRKQTEVDDVGFVRSEELSKDADDVKSARSSCGRADLRTKGLCLVPLSMAIHYLE